jgi:hypothetical protein
VRINQVYIGHVLRRIEGALEEVQRCQRRS